jgi:hypothetical protein
VSLSSDNKRFHGYPKESKRKPSTDSTGFRSKESGMGWDRAGRGDLPPLEERRAWEFDFVRQHLPGEHPGFAVSALLSLRLLGVKPTKAAILERLEASGRSARQLREKGWA